MSNVTPLTRPPVPEGRPFHAANSDGTVNVGSYEVAGALDAVRLWLDEHDTPPDRAEVRYLARSCSTPPSMPPRAAVDLAVRPG